MQLACLASTCTPYHVKGTHTGHLEPSRSPYLYTRNRIINIMDSKCIYTRMCVLQSVHARLLTSSARVSNLKPRHQSRASTYCRHYVTTLVEVIHPA